MKANKSCSSSNGAEVSQNSSNTNSNGAAISTNSTRVRKNRVLTNNDYCSYCDEGGDLLSCDRCPASFHFLCSEPPLDLDQIPKGDFLCNKCKTISSIVDKKSADANFDTSVINNDTKTIKFEVEENESALETLIRIAKSLNPRQMQLSDDLNLECAFDLPGLNKIKWWTKDGNKIVNVSKNSIHYSNTNPNSHLYEMNSANLNNRSIDPATNKTKSSYNDENDSINSLKGAKSNGVSNEISSFNGANGDTLVNHTELCFICNKTSRDKIYHLIKCDFCPLRFHMDCLNLPLCSMPSRERLWMCPNHLENFLEQNMVKSSRLSERINLWKEYSNSKLNLDSVKFDFIKKCNTNTKNSNGDFRVDPRNVERCHIPEQIKNMYSKEKNAVLNRTSSNHSEINSDKTNFKIDSLVSNKLVRNFSNESEKESYLSAVEALTLLCNPNKENSNDLIHRENKNTFLVNPPPIHKYNSNAIKPRALLVPIASSCHINEKKKLEIISSLMNSQYDAIDMSSEFKQPHHMPYRYLTIGSASNMNVCLDKSNHCECISDKHACIYYDEQTNHYELLNYSEFGTTVDNCKYGLDTSNTVDYSDSESDLENPGSKEMSSKSLNYLLKDECQCRSIETNREVKKYWEGPALLNHGSHLKIGCLSFLFIIVDSDYDFISVENLNNLSRNRCKNSNSNGNNKDLLFSIKKHDMFSLSTPSSMNSNNKKLKRLKTKAVNSLKRHSLKNYNDDHIEGFIKLMNNNQKKKLLIK